MHVALVKDCEDHVHHEHCQCHQDRQAGHGTTKRQRLALQLRTYATRDGLSRCLRNEVRSIAKRDARLEVEGESHAGELVQVVHHLWAECLLPRHELAQWYKPATIV